MATLSSMCQAVFVDLCTEMGSSVSFVRKTSTSLDDADRPSKGYTTLTGEPSTHSVTCLINEIRVGMADSETYRIGDIILQVPSTGLTITPNTYDRVTLSSKTYNVLSVQHIRVSGTDIGFRVHIRG